MKLTFVLLTAGFLNVYATGISQMVSFSGKNVSLESVFSSLKKQTGFVFIYTDPVLKAARPVTINAEGMPIEEFLYQIFKSQPLLYEIKNRNIIIALKPVTRSADPQPIISLTDILADTLITVTGRVVDDNEGPLEGATVAVKEGNQSTSSNASGEFTINGIRKDAVLVISHIAFQTQEVGVRNNAAITIRMSAKAGDLNDIVVVGYGTQKKVDVTGSVVTLKGKDIVKNHTPNVLNSLTGRLPGVIINNRSGEPGKDEPTIAVRGRSTTGNASPLIIIDGVERTSLGKLNPSDIENISVLKDASAAIYGARAANGVILVTTKQGSTGKPAFEFSINQAYTQPTRLPKLADSETWAKMYNEVEAGIGRAPRYTEEEIEKFRNGTDPNYPNTDWFDYAIRKFTPQNLANISASGGSDRFKYYFALGNVYQEGSYTGGVTTVKRMNARSNIEVQATDFLKVGLRLAVSNETTIYPWQSTGFNYSHIFLYQPNWQLYWPGTDYLQPLRDGESIINLVGDKKGTDKTNTKRLESTLFLKLDVPGVKGLSANATFNYDPNYFFNSRWQIPTYVHYSDGQGGYNRGLSGSSPQRSDLGQRFTQFSALTANATVDYNRAFRNHKLGLMVGYEQREVKSNTMYAYRSNFVSSSLPQLFAGSSDRNNQSNDGTASAESRQNIFGRATYDFAGKYLAQFIFRRDGSTNFPKDKRFGFFPGVSVGWRMSEEPFMQQFRAIDNLKLRASYGEIGNDVVAPFQYLTSYGFGNNYVIGGNDVIGLVQSGVPNPNITWEVARTTNLGFEATLWNGLLGVEFDLFKTRRSNILAKRNAVIPEYTGLLLPDENIGIVENKGFELQLFHSNNQHAVRYSLGANISFARNKVIFAAEAPAAEPYQLATGRPIGSLLILNAIGIFKDEADINANPHYVGAQPGDVKYADMNKDGIIDSRDRIRIDQTVTPEIVYGFNADISYKSFDLSILFQGQDNANLLLGGYYPVLSYSLGNFADWRAEDRWTPENTDASMPRASLELFNNNTSQSTHWLVNAAFLRLKNLEIGYSLPESIVRRLKMKSLRLYANGNNLLILKDHMGPMGMDPETSTYWYYPQLRTFNFGLNLNF